MLRRTHRHLVAVPLTLALLASVLAVRPTGGQNASAAQVNPAQLSAGQTATSGAFGMQPGIAGTLDAGSSLRADGLAEATLLGGSALIRTDGFFRLSLGGGTVVHGMRAGWFVLRDAGGSLVVALSVPLAVTARGQTEVLAAGEQLRIPDDTAAATRRSGVPQAWLQEHVAALEALPQADAGLPETDSLKELTAMIADGNTAGAAAYMADANRDAMLGQDASRPVLAAILAQLGGGTPDADGIVAALACAKRLDGDVPADIMLSLSFGVSHAARGDERAEQVLADAFTVGDNAATYAQLITDADTSASMPLPDTFPERWRQLTERIAATDAPAAAHAIAMAVRLPGAWEDRGFPVHARRWEEAVKAARTMVGSLLSPDDRAVLDDAVAAAAIARLPDVQAPASSSSPAAPVPARPAEELIADARQAILGHGGMVSTTTSFVVPVAEPDAVRVLGAVFPTRAGDASFDFTYHPSRGVLDKIVLQGHLFPNALTFEQFAASL